MLQYHFLVKVNRCSQRADPLIFRSAFKCNMRRVLVARGGALSPFPGLGGSHQRFVSLLESGEITGYSLADILEYPVAGNSLARAYRRWSSHPKRVAKAAGKGQADILHITDQEQAHLVHIMIIQCWLVQQVDITNMMEVWLKAQLINLLL